MEYTSNRFEYGAKIIFYLLAAALPLWFIPWPIGVEFGREVTFTALVLLVFIFALLASLMRGELAWQHSPILYAAGGLAAVFGAATLLSRAPLVSAVFADPTAERLSTLVLGILLMLLLGAVFRTREEAGACLLILIFSGGVSALLNLAQLLFNFSLFRFIASFAQGIDFNVIGTMNGLALFYTGLLAMSVGLVVSPAFRNMKPWARLALTVAALLFAANLLFINFRTAWIVLLVAGVFVFGLLFKDMREGNRRFDWRYSLAMILIALAIVMILLRTPLRDLGLPAEVSPSFSATLNVAKSVFKDGVPQTFFGSGPGTFGLDWSRYKDPAINQTLFWGIRFNQGFSWFTTLLPTVGLAGTVAFLGFLGITLFVALRSLLTTAEEERALAMSSFLGFISLVSASALYPANFSLVLFLFLSVGLITFLFSGEGGTRTFWDIRERTIRFQSPWAVFLSSLLVIFLVSLAIAGLYLAGGRLRAAFLVQSGLARLNEGKFDQALAQLERATRWEERHFRNHQILVQARMGEIQNLIQRASVGENVQQPFQTAVARAIQESDRAIQLYSAEPLLWRTQGALYELIIPFIQGSERFAFASYRRASELDPLNPAIWVDWGRAGMIFADRIQLLQNQASARDRETLAAARLTTLREVEEVFKRAIAVKSDFAPAHFLAAQTAIRLGNIQSAIQSTENAKSSAPFDIGIAFQLGLLYYQSNDFDRAEGEFLRSLSLNPNYSNARYFLGLIYDRRGEKAKALREFETVELFNPDNEEVKRIIANLKGGERALAGIVPPATPPERRRETPVGEETTPAAGRESQ